MMFVFGEVQEPLEDTMLLVEEIVRSQMIETTIQAVAQANKRGARSIGPEDIVFLIRHDRPKVNRLRSFLSWKDVRKNVKDNKEAGAPTEEDMLEDQDKPARIKRMKVKFSWDHLNTYSGVLSDNDDDGADEEERQAYEDQITRLRLADNITSSMTKEEYMYYSECRQASFTYKKVKRFCDWCEMKRYYDIKASSDVIDILGFLAYEIVNSITETALSIKREWDEEEKRKEIRRNRGTTSTDPFLFDKRSDERTPLQPIHIREAFRQLQVQSTPLGSFGVGVKRSKLALM
ncbi:Transcription initiation protein spt3 [Polyrhizophydium stewartii]|uniref:Transcription initiation protein spt3 n=1 Tax=Polyrhizophydium stewartii TaxID=2732419 RepID=A0ABR4N8I4_9FUNG|nr:Transcription initiation protein spt3 [Polyrhizophydium stewartii]